MSGEPSICREKDSEPEVREIAPNHQVKCHFPEREGSRLDPRRISVRELELGSSQSTISMEQLALVLNHSSGAIAAAAS